MAEILYSLTEEVRNSAEEFGGSWLLLLLFFLLLANSDLCICVFLLFFFPFQNENEDENGNITGGVSDENLILNSLIYDYLVYNGYKSTGMVLLRESKMGSELKEGKRQDSDARKLLSNDELKDILRVEDGGDLPILYSLIK